jgi:hypothetical protein
MNTDHFQNPEDLSMNIIGVWTQNMNADRRQNTEYLRLNSGTHNDYIAPSFPGPRSVQPIVQLVYVQCCPC